MPVDTNLATPQARALGAALREIRERTGISGRELGKRLGLSHSAVSHWETAKRAPTPEEAASLLTALGVVGAEKHRLIELARDASDPNWFSVGLHGVSDRVGAVIECERAASSMVDWQAGVITGLLQTADYSRAMMVAAGMSQADADNAALIRAGRKEVLTRRQPLRLHALIGEAALRNEIGGPWVLADQLRHLLELGERPNITVQAVPNVHGWHPGLVGPFALYDFPSAPTVIYFEHFRSSAFDPDPDDVQAYHDAVAAILDVARNPEETRDFVAAIARSKEQADDVDPVAQVQPQSPQ